MLDSMPAVDPEERVPPVLLENALGEAQISGARLARELGMDAGSISNWRTGKTPLSTARWIAVVAAVKKLRPSWSPPDWRPGDAPPAPKPIERRRGRRASH